MLDMLFPARCAGCGRGGDAFCEACRPSAEALRTFLLDDFEVRAVACYAGPLRRAILAYKRGRRDVGDVLAALLADRTAALLPPASVLVPIPTVAGRRRERGYDQSVRLARHLGERSGRPVLLALHQTTGDAQRGRSRSARLEAKHRFACREREPLADVRVVLVDDVVTTGATLVDAACALRARGARPIAAVVLAYA